ncbi:MAG: sigma-70 family RNA polymerase sigma factor [Bryobacterales bacterium]|nr:sigma-70 family RNA polymerase sigma factor [Bryobacterales bacterium]MDE0436140.1 sigma-70 family RNA polymerase sigma factor [Bryobacterales bacterium]
MASEAAIHPWSTPWMGSRQEGGYSEQIAREAAERDANLVRRCLHGDGSAWEALVRVHTRVVYATCYRFTGHSEDARDLTQEVFLRVYRGLGSYQPEAAAFRTWLLRLTRNLLIDHYRRSRKDKVLEPLEDQISGIEETSEVGGRADHTLVRREASEKLRAALDRMSPELREAVILRDLQQMEYQEIAGVLDIPQGTVKSRINRGRRDLAKHLRIMGVRP